MMCVVVPLPLPVPVSFASVLGRRADAPLDATHQWVGGNARTIGTVIEAAFAVYLLITCIC